MKSEQVLNAHILDIIFENRNKAYGAYTLRKFYNNRLFTSMGITFLFVTLMMVWLFIFGKPGKTIPVLYAIPSGHELREIKPLMEKPKLPQKPVLPKKPSVKPIAATQAFVSRIHFTDNHATRLASNLDSLIIAGTTNAGAAGGDSRTVTGNASATDNKIKPDTNKIADRKVPLPYADIPPSFPGGEEALLRFLQRNLQNPADLDNGQVVSVKIKFVVGYDGHLRGFEVTEDGGRIFNNEVIRVLKKMPAWNPGKNAGEDVSVYYSLPVKFMGQD
mgnify:FL=1